MLADGLDLLGIDATGDGAHGFNRPADDAIVVDGAGLVYVTGTLSHNVFKIEPLPCPGNIVPPHEGDIRDSLALLATWGQIGVPADLVDPPGVGIEDFLELLAHWGECP